MRNKLIKMNRSDFLFLVLEDVLSSAGILVTIRFKTKHSSAEIYDAMRYMVSIYPRLRSIVQPSLFSYRIRILDDNTKRTDILFDDAFKVESGLLYDSEAYFEYRKSLLNEPFSLEQALPLKIRYIPDNPMPVLLLSVHHMICDGKSWMHMADSLLAFLNGKRTPCLPLHSSSTMPALLKKPYYTLFQQIFRSFNAFKKDFQELKDKRIINASSRPAAFFGIVDMQQNMLSFDFQLVSSTLEKLGCSFSVLIISALVLLFYKKSKVEDAEKEIISINIAIDLRPYFEENKPVFGNFVSSLNVNVSPMACTDRKLLVSEVNTKLRRRVSKFRNKEVVFPMLVHKLSTIVGKKNYGRAIRITKRRGEFLPMTCAFSNLGNLDNLNSHGEKAQVCEAIATVAAPNLFISTSVLDGKINTIFSFPEAEFTQKEVGKIIQSFEHELGELLIL